MTATPVRVRRVVPRDLPRLVELCAEHAAYERATFTPSGQLERLERALFAEAPRLHAWVAEQDDTVIGYATATLDYATWEAAPFAHLDCLYLRPEVRGKGVGARLLAEVITLAKQEGCINVQWQTPPWNTSAIRFYERQGAASFPKRRFTLPLQPL